MACASAVGTPSAWPVHKPARTTWHGTPLHELWLLDPSGNLVEIYARLTDDELAQMPEDKEPSSSPRDGTRIPVETPRVASVSDLHPETGLL